MLPLQNLITIYRQVSKLLNRQSNTRLCWSGFCLKLYPPFPLPPLRGTLSHKWERGKNSPRPLAGEGRGERGRRTVLNLDVTPI